MNLVRSGTKQPQSIPSSAGGQARHSVIHSSPMTYQVLARKWRPRASRSSSARTHVVTALANALEPKRLHHAYLFTGTRGVGKTTLARILAKALNCETGITPQPCGKCRACIGDRRGPLRRPARGRRGDQHQGRRDARAARHRAVHADRAAASRSTSSTKCTCSRGMRSTRC